MNIHIPVFKKEDIGKKFRRRYGGTIGILQYIGERGEGVMKIGSDPDRFFGSTMRSEWEKC